MATLPTTEIVLCRNVPLDNSYDHQVTFASQQAQATYFYSKAYKTLTANTYQRIMSNRLRIQCTIGEAMACNYLFFSNNSHDGKTIYAFITGWQYVNDITTEITYEVDVFQTFWFDVDLKPCFVEREHSNTDNIGDNLVDEGLATGDYVLDGYSADAGADEFDVVFFCTFRCAYDSETQTWTYIDGATLFSNRSYNGLFPNAFECNLGGYNLITSWLAQMPPENYNGIVSAVIMPRASVTYINTPYNQYSHEVFKTTHFAYLTRSDNQTIKNKKLFTFPYTCLYATTYNGVNATYRYEDFHYPNYENTCSFLIIGDVTPSPAQCAVPLYYKGVAENADEMITLTGFPQVSWATDSFKAWLAQNASNIASVAIGIAGAVATGGASLAASAAPRPVYNDSLGSYRVFANQANEPLALGNTAASIGSSMTPISGAASLLIGGVQAWNTPPQARGNIGQGLMHRSGLDHIGFYNKHIRPEYVTMIDDFFNMYGYATRKVKIPNIMGRPYWNYVKTQGIVLDIANAPQPYIQKMIDCFNRGITFWHNPANVGNYNLNNSPVTTP